MTPCASDPDRWFPDDETPEEVVEEAVITCFTDCGETRRLECLAGALARREPFGIWGGWTTEERDALLTRREKVPA